VSPTHNQTHKHIHTLALWFLVDAMANIETEHGADALAKTISNK